MSIRGAAQLRPTPKNSGGTADFFSRQLLPVAGKSRTCAGGGSSPMATAGCLSLAELQQPYDDPHLADKSPGFCLGWHKVGLSVGKLPIGYRSK